MSGDLSACLSSSRGKPRITEDTTARPISISCRQPGAVTDTRDLTPTKAVKDCARSAPGLGDLVEPGRVQYEHGRIC